MDKIQLIFSDMNYMTIIFDQIKTYTVSQPLA